MLVDKKIKEVVGLNLPVAMICPSHGIMWRKDPLQIVNKYVQWAGNYQENQITIIYDTMWNGTRKMAEAIAEGIKSGGQHCCSQDPPVRPLGQELIFITEVFKSKALLVGSPTVNRGILSAVGGILEEDEGPGV